MILCIQLDSRSYASEYNENPQKSVCLRVLFPMQCDLRLIRTSLETKCGYMHTGYHEVAARTEPTNLLNLKPD